MSKISNKALPKFRVVHTALPTAKTDHTVVNMALILGVCFLTAFSYDLLMFPQYLHLNIQ